MVRTRPKSKHARQLLIALGLSVAAGAMAHTLVGGQHHHADDGAGGALQIAGNGGGDARGQGAGGQGSDGSGSGGGGVGVGASTGGPQDVTEAARQSVYGPGEEHDGPRGDGFMPNGEDGLMILADYVRNHGDGLGANSNDNSDHVPGTPPDGDGDGAGFPVGGQDGSGPIGANGDGPTPGGFGGFGGGGGGGGFGGGGGGGGGGAGGPGGGTPGSSGPGGGGGGAGPNSGPGPGGPTGPVGGVGGDGGTVCVVSAIDTCGQPTGDPVIPPRLPPPILPPGNPGNDAAPVVVTSVPEPSVWLMLTLGFGSLGATLRRQRREARETFA